MPGVMPPGAIQPRAPGQKDAPALPELHWEGRDPAISRVEWASNGHLEVAHALILIPTRQDTASSRLRLAQAAVDGAFQSRPSLSEVDVSCYRAETYCGFGGPLPSLTASVPKRNQREFGRLTSTTLTRYGRLWTGQRPIFRSGNNVSEGAAVFTGSDAELQQQRALHQQSGLHDGLFFSGPHQTRRVALTFDDSPHPLFEPLLLDDLRRCGVRASFFCIGRNALAYPYFISDMVAQGHEVANHTFHHVRLPGLSVTEMTAELSEAQNVLERLSGQRVDYFRPPGGEYSPLSLAVANQLGLTTTFWTDDPGDFDHPDEVVLENRLQEHLRAGGIVLLHDNVQETVQVLPVFLKVARSRGYQLVPVGQLARSLGPSGSPPNP